MGLYGRPPRSQRDQRARQMRERLLDIEIALRISLDASVAAHARRFVSSVQQAAFPVLGEGHPWLLRMTDAVRCARAIESGAEHLAPVHSRLIAEGFDAASEAIDLLNSFRLDRIEQRLGERVPCTQPTP